MPRSGGALLWINKTSLSSSLSHSHDAERLEIFSKAQRTSRPHKTTREGRQELITQRELDGTAARARCTSSHRRRRGAKGIQGTQHETGAPLCKATISPSLAYGTSWKITERQALDFFLHATVYKIVHLQRDHCFWTETVPCMATRFAVVRHLLQAIVHTHKFILDKTNKTADTSALEQCNRATFLLCNFDDLPLPLLLISCILVSAYCLLRCDLAQADLTIEGGLKLSGPAANASQSPYQGLYFILVQLKNRHGFKLWTADIAFQFEKVDSSHAPIEIETDWIQHPLTSVGEVLQAWKDLMVQVVAKIARNVARGAYIDPGCLLATSTCRQLNLLSENCRILHDETPLQSEDQRLALKQLQIGINHAILLFHTKLISPVESFFDDARFDICQDSLSHADDLLAARRDGHSLLYMDRVVNGALFALGLCSRSLSVRQHVIALLQNQALEEDGLVHWIRGAVLGAFKSVEDGVRVLAPTLASAWIILIDVSYMHATKEMRIEYAFAADDEVVRAENRTVDWHTWTGPALSVNDINACLEGIVAAYRMYSKPRASQARRGCLRQMLHRDVPVPVHWEAGVFS